MADVPSLNSTIPRPSWLPVRGKTAAWRRIDQLRDEAKQIVAELDATVATFQRAIREPRPLHLGVQRLTSGAVYLRWRKAGIRGRQPYLQLDGEEATQLLQGLSPEVRQLYLRFHQRATDLNLAHALNRGEQRRLARYLEQLKSLEQWQTHTGE